MIPAGITRDHVIKAIADFDGGVSHDFDPSTRYDLVHEGLRYLPNAIVGLAARYVAGQPLTPKDFSGGVASTCNRMLQELGFEVVTKELGTPVADRFRVGVQYTRNDIYRLLDVPQDRQGGNWHTGYHRYNDESLIFANVGGAGRTGHDYPNRFEGNRATTSCQSAAPAPGTTISRSSPWCPARSRCTRSSGRRTGRPSPTRDWHTQPTWT
jgi:5-methylcytosine-specific restriction protein A